MQKYYGPTQRKYANRKQGGSWNKGEFILPYLNIQSSVSDNQNMNQKAKWVISLLPLFLVGFLISQEEKFFSSSTKENYKITYFQPKDLSRDAFLVSVRTRRPDIFLEELKAKPPKWRIQVEGVVGIKRKKNSNEIIEKRGIIYADIYESYIQLDKDDPFLVNFEVILYSKIEPGEANVQLFRIEGEEENLVANYQIEIPERYSNPGKQPIVYSITPEAGKRGDTITVIGKNFGNDIDDIVLYFGEFIKTEQGEVYREILERKPFYLSSVNEEGNQELKFHIPSRTDLTKDYLYKRNLTLQVNVNGRPSGLLKLVVLTESWKLWLGLFSILILALLYLCLVFVLKKFNFSDMLFIDKTTNTYSLSRFQAFIWTVVLIGGYFYIAICNGLLLGKGVIPDFPPSLIGLLSVSYVG
ncbi:MAG: IPT/TIG domain-containing protein, partial [Leptospiraceae bacterium]|nr:IPT/TIG domain-containing protein [Leptospiraceae bacterium]